MSDYVPPVPLQEVRGCSLKRKFRLRQGGRIPDPFHEIVALRATISWKG